MILEALVFMTLIENLRKVYEIAKKYILHLEMPEVPKTLRSAFVS